MKRNINKQHGSKSTNHNLYTDLDVTCLSPLIKPVFPERFVRVIDGRGWVSHVISKCGNGSKEIADRWQNTSVCQTQCLLGVICKVLNTQTLSFITFAFLKNVCYHYLNFVLRVITWCFLWAADWPTTNLLFSCNLIGQLNV